MSLRRHFPYERSICSSSLIVPTANLETLVFLLALIHSFSDQMIRDEPVLIAQRTLPRRE